MPGFNGTGPQGQGPMTGRGLGPCGGGMGYGRGFGRGYGRGAGYGRWSGVGYNQPTKSEETSDTKGYIEDLKSELKNVQDYLKDLEAKK